MIVKKVLMVTFATMLSLKLDDKKQMLREFDDDLDAELISQITASQVLIFYLALAFEFQQAARIAIFTALNIFCCGCVCWDVEIRHPEKLVLSHKYEEEQLR